MASNGRGASGKRASSWWENLNTSFWFLPAVLTLAGILLAFITQPLDQLLQPFIDQLPTIISGGAEGAGSVLSAISGSLITVIATVFSLTMVILTLASGQYSPRLLRSFTSDRGLQVVLGFYIGTFVYSLLVLRLVSIASGSEASFNPVVSVAVTIILALVCVGLLIYFINHVAHLIQSSTIVHMAYADTMDSVGKLADRAEGPEEIKEPEDDPFRRDLISETPSVVLARASGYVQDLDIGSILAAVGDERTAFVDLRGPGSYVSEGLPLAKVWPPAGKNGNLDGDAGGRVNRAFVFGRERSFRRDPAFGLRQLADVALKGLSPGINDPTTTMQAMDRIESVFIALGEKALPPRVRYEELDDREVMVRVGVPAFEDYVGLAFDQVRRAAFTSGQVAVLEQTLEVLDRAARANDDTRRQTALWDRAFAIARLAPDQIDDPRDATNLMLRAVQMVYGMTLKARVAIDADLDRLFSVSEDLEGGDQVREAVDDVRHKAEP